MARDETYREAEQRIDEARWSGSKKLDLSGGDLTELPNSLGQLMQLEILELSGNQLTTLPEWLSQLTQLRDLNLSSNQLTTLPESLGQLRQLRELYLGSNRLTTLPGSLDQLMQLQVLYLAKNKLTTVPKRLGQLAQLQALSLAGNQLTTLPESLGQLTQLRELYLSGNQLTTLPTSLCRLEHLQMLFLGYNPHLNPELKEAYKEGLDAVMRYLRAKAEAQVVLNEAKLILIGEGEVGKSCLLGALRGDPWEEGLPTTHGIEIKPVAVIAPGSGTRITLNGWDFGGQRVYRPTHQLFFSAPAVYLVVWKPREGSQAGQVKEWIKLVKHREPDAKIIVVATHGGPRERQPDIDRQEIWDLFGKETVLEFFHVENKPDEKTDKRRGIAELTKAIARVAAGLPEMGRTVPARWQEAREALQQTGAAYLPLEQVLKLCEERKMEEEEAKDFVRISHRLGHLIHYEHDPALREIVVLKPDWLSTAVSFVLDDKQTRDGHGLVSFTRLGRLWNDPAKDEEFRYPPKLHSVFRALMERFDLSYQVAEPHKSHADGTSLIAQLVPDIRPEEDLDRAWTSHLSVGDEQQVQICRIVDAKNGQSARAEGLFYQLIVRLHKYSLGRVNYAESVHWQRGLVLDNDYNGRALLEYVGNDVRITVRAPYPERLLAVLTNEVKWLVESFWAGLRCEVMVPCVAPCGKDAPGAGLFEVEKLIAFKRQGMMKFPCMVSGCSQAQDIDGLLRNAPSSRRTSIEQLLAQGFDQMRSRLDSVRVQLNQQDRDAEERFQVLDLNDRRIMSQVDDAFTGLMQALTDEAKEGPRLFSFQPVEPGFFDRPKWISQKFRLTLWCEHSRMPLPAINGKDDRRGIYELNMPREWFVKAAPFLKILTGTLSLVLPVALSAMKLALDETAYKEIEKELELGKAVSETLIKGGEHAVKWLEKKDYSKLEEGEAIRTQTESADLEHGDAIRAQGSVLRELQALLKDKDPGFGGLVRVQNKRQEFLWVHPRYAVEY